MQRWNKDVLVRGLHAIATEHGNATEHSNTAGLDSIALSVRQKLRLARIAAHDLKPMPDKGLAHDHLLIDGTDLLLRIPKQSQLALSAEDNLVYQSRCFMRMLPSNHTPRLYGVLPASAELQMGALLVERIVGHVPQHAGDFESIARALAAIHRLPLPDENQRAPLLNQKNALIDTFREIEAQSRYLSAARLDNRSYRMIDAELEKARLEVSALDAPPVCLISFDAHPGNYLLDAEGRAMLVDLEKARYGGAGFDLAHASLYTSTTWDTDINIVLERQDLENFHAAWLHAVPDEFAAAMQPYLVPMRRLMWLWSVTWCAKWKVESRASVVEQKHRAENTEDWAQANNPDDLVNHVRDRVDHYLQGDVINRIRDDFT